MNSSSSETKSKTNEVQSNFRASLKQQLFFDIEIKRESRFVSKWKKRSCVIVYLPNQELSLTIKNKDKKETTEEIINLRNTKISKRCSIVENHHCFGMEISSGKRYLISRESESKTFVIFDNIVRLKNYFLKKSSQKEPESPMIKNSEKYPFQLEFERSNIVEERQDRQERQEKQERWRKQEEKFPNPLFITPVKQEYEKEQKIEVNQRVQMVEEDQNDEEYRTVMEDQPLPIIEEEPEIHLKVPLTSLQLSYLGNDEGFKLCQNFNQGRLLQKSSTYLKSNLILKTHLNQFELLQSFFHFELWNDKVVKYQVLNRIDEGIYLVYLQLKKRHFYSCNRYCYLMATSIIINTQPCLILKSLNRNDFDSVPGCEWIDITIWTKARGSNENNLQKFLTSCLKIQDSSCFDQALDFSSQIKRFQSFLYTTYTLPFKMLGWRNEEKVIFLS